MRATRQLRWGGVLLLFMLGNGGAVQAAQTEPVGGQPYASMDRNKVDYRGPGRGKNSDFTNSEVRIGILLPLQGKGAADGKWLLKAAQIAIEEENKATPPAKGQRFVLAVEEESGPWGQASNAMIRLILQDEAVALITSSNGNVAHQAEQIANKIGIAVLTLASDPTTTQINIPWIFRVGASDTTQAEVMAERIYRSTKSTRVLLITETGHDGRVGGAEFLKAALSLHAETPQRMDLNADESPAGMVERELGLTKPDAVVLWTSPTLANRLVPLIRQALPSKTIYLSQKAADFYARTDSDASGPDGQMYTVGPQLGHGEFEGEYYRETGQAPGIAAQQIAEAVRTIAEAVRRAGPNRVRLRDRLVSAGTTEATDGVIGFDQAGNLRSKVTLVGVEIPQERRSAVAPD